MTSVTGSTFAFGLPRTNSHTPCNLTGAAARPAMTGPRPWSSRARWASMTASINTCGTEPLLTEFIESTGGAMPYDDDTDENETQTLDDWASELFLLYITQADCWFN